MLDSGDGKFRCRLEIADRHLAGLRSHFCHASLARYGVSSLRAHEFDSGWTNARCCVQRRIIDSKALTEAKWLADELGAPTPSLRGLVSVLEKAEAAQVQLTANKVLSASQNIQDVVGKNRKLFESEMTYINGTLTLIAKAAVVGKGPYRTRKNISVSVLVNAAA